MMEIYFADIEYKLIDGYNGGFTYAFVKAKGVYDSRGKISKSLKKHGMKIIECKACYPYDEKQEWSANPDDNQSAEEVTNCYKRLYREAKNKRTPVFDIFYEYKR